MAEWLARQTHNHKIVGSSPAKSSQLRRKWVPGYRQGCSDTARF